MPVLFSRSAARHGIHRDRARYVVEHCAFPLYSPEPDRESLVLFLGPDERGVPLEVVGVELADGDHLVIHVMRLREMHRAEYTKVMRWHEP
jgi:hypothetical protein